VVLAYWGLLPRPGNSSDPCYVRGPWLRAIRAVPVVLFVWPVLLAEWNCFRLGPTIGPISVRVVTLEARPWAALLRLL
jgi:hypothetical protein